MTEEREAAAPRPFRRATVAGAAVEASSLAGTAAGLAGASNRAAGVREYDVLANGITLHVTERGQGPTVILCHGFPDTSRTWRRQMAALASDGYRAIAPDMRGYGRSSAPAEANVYTPLQTVGDLIGLLDALSIPDAAVVGHDWGSVVAAHAALMRPDRFTALFLLSVPYVPRGDLSLLDHMRATGHGCDFYMFGQIEPQADRIWREAAVTIPGVLYWASGSAPATDRWDPLDPARGLHRPAPGPLPGWADQDYVSHNIAEFQRTGFHGGLNYYRALQTFFDLSAPWRGARIAQPAFMVSGAADGANAFCPTRPDELRLGMPNLRGAVMLDGVGHWSQHEAADQVSGHLLRFLRDVTA